jgi:transposase
MARKRRAFTRDFKTEAVRLCKAGDRSIGQVAKDLDLTETALRSWLKQADVDAGDGPPEALTTAEREELASLRKQVKRLEMEREILKKAGGVLNRSRQHVLKCLRRRQKSEGPAGSLIEALSDLV